MALNVKRLLEELRFVTIHPDKHEQGLWAEARTEVPIPEGLDWYEVAGLEAPRPSACGSFGCLAGNTAIHEPGVELDWYQQDYERQGGNKIAIWQADNILDEFVEKTDVYDGSRYSAPKSISKKAQELLDLTEFQADRLFDGDNTLDRLWELADQFSGGEINSDTSSFYSHYSEALRERDRVEREAKLEALSKLNQEV